jgi:hypothetical protein
LTSLQTSCPRASIPSSNMNFIISSNLLERINGMPEAPVLQGIVKVMFHLTVPLSVVMIMTKTMPVAEYQASDTSQLLRSLLNKIRPTGNSAYRIEVRFRALESSRCAL